MDRTILIDSFEAQLAQQLNRALAHAIRLAPVGEHREYELGLINDRSVVAEEDVLLRVPAATRQHVVGHFVGVDRIVAAGIIPACAALMRSVAVGPAGPTIGV